MNELYHHGIQGQKWGRRRWQNEDGTYTEAGKKRYFGTTSSESKYREAKSAYKDANRQYSKDFGAAYRRSLSAYSPSKKHRQANDERWEKAFNSAEKANLAKKELKKAKTQFKYDKKINKIESEKENIVSARAKNKLKFENRFDQKIAKTTDKISNTNDDRKIKALTDKVKALKDRKAEWSKDFDEGTLFVKSGYDKYSSVIKNYKNAKVSALEDRTYKGSDEYKQAVKQYVGQRLSDLSTNMGRHATIFKYSSDAARDYYLDKDVKK